MSNTKPKGADRFKAMLDRARESDRYWVEGAKIELAEQIFVAMQERGVSEAELSRLLGVSRAYVNKVLKGAANLTIESLVKIGRALGREFKFAFNRLDENAEDVLDTEYIYETARSGRIEVNSSRRNKHTKMPGKIGKAAAKLPKKRPSKILRRTPRKASL